MTLGVQRFWRRWSQKDEIKALIWVVDASDHIRFAEGRDALKDFLDGENVPQGVPLLVLANKQDLPGAVNVTELAKELELRDIHGRPWHIMVRYVSYATYARTWALIYWQFLHSSLRLPLLAKG